MELSDGDAILIAAACRASYLNCRGGTKRSERTNQRAEFWTFRGLLLIHEDLKWASIIGPTGDIRTDL
jgi:hypothetical protein